MKNLLIVLISLLFVTAGIAIYQQGEIERTKAERNVYRTNTSSLLEVVERYKTKDSLNAISVGSLELKLWEYMKYRQEDYKVIESLKLDNKRLKEIATAETKTIYDVKTVIRDSLIYIDRQIVDTLRCIDIAEKWFDIHGCANSKNEFTGRFENREALKYVEHVIPKKFLFIKWGCKERRQEIVSMNPATEIISAEFVTIRK